MSPKTADDDCNGRHTRAASRGRSRAGAETGAGRHFDAVLEGGSGSPMVLLHGPGEHAAKWMEVFPELVANHRVIAPDLPGHGASVVTGGPLTSERVLQWLDELIDRTCSSPPVLVGQIVGGAIAVRHVIRQGSPMSRLVLVDTLGLAPFQPAPEFAGALHAFLAEPERPDLHWPLAAVRVRSRCVARADGWAVGCVRELHARAGPLARGAGRSAGVAGAVRVRADPAGGAGPHRGADVARFGAGTISRPAWRWPRRRVRGTAGRCT